MINILYGTNFYMNQFYMEYNYDITTMQYMLYYMLDLWVGNYN